MPIHQRHLAAAAAALHCTDDPLMHLPHCPVGTVSMMVVAVLPVSAPHQVSEVDAPRIATQVAYLLVPHVIIVITTAAFTAAAAAAAAAAVAVHELCKVFIPLRLGHTCTAASCFPGILLDATWIVTANGTFTAAAADTTAWTTATIATAVAAVTAVR